MRKGVDDDAALEAFMSAHRYPAGEGLIGRDLKVHPVHPREHRGNAGAYFDFGRAQAMEAHISELPPGGATKMHRHMCEGLFYVLAGRGYSVVEEEGKPAQKVEWEEGDLFYTPMFAWHQHVNADPARPAPNLEITTLPLMKAVGAWRIGSAA